MSDKKILLLAYPGCIMFEVLLAVELLSKEYTIVMASPRGEAITSAGLQYLPGLDYETAAHLKEYSGVLIPGGDPGLIMEDMYVDQIIKACVHTQGVIAAICAGVLVTAKTGVLVDRRATHNYTSQYATDEVVFFTSRYWEGLVYEEGPVVVDENIITSMPWSSIEFAVRAAVALHVIEEDRALDAIQYYRGNAPI